MRATVAPDMLQAAGFCSRVVVAAGRHWSRSCQDLVQDRGMQSPRDFSMYGAVDLGARQAAAQRRQQVAKAAASAGAGDGGPAGGSASAFVFDATEETFND